MELEQEFTIYKNKYIRYVYSMLVDYFRTLEITQVNLSGAFYESPETKAKKLLRARKLIPLG